MGVELDTMSLWLINRKISTVNDTMIKALSNKVLNVSILSFGPSRNEDVTVEDVTIKLKLKANEDLSRNFPTFFHR